ncbi:MAG: carboxymuconolactone decarboxylase family protein [Maricaulaceae bacterium]
MSFLPSLPENTHLIKDVWPTFPKGVSELLAFIDVVMHGESELTIPEREIIFAYVSALQDCKFCFNAHACFAEEYGATREAVDGLWDLDNPPASDKMKPVLAYTRKISEAPHTVTKADVDALLAAGWTEQGVADIVYSIGVSNMMTRVVAGFGVQSQQQYFDALRERHRRVAIEDRRAKEAQAQGQPKYVNFVKLDPLTASNAA